jgi:uncharacterized SAM-binding protein YcdF (DUF218 family)
MTMFPCLSEQTLKAANTLGQWLAQNDFSSKPGPVRADAVILAGNAVIPVIDAAFDIASRHHLPLVISGGIGHSTTFLYHAVACHPHYNQIPTTGKPEAVILAEIAQRFWGIPKDNIVVEDRSSNCGENARFTFDAICSRGMNLTTALVMQDPTMQRRTMATFARVSQDSENTPHWLSYPGFTPELINTSDGLTFLPPADGLWPVERYLSLILGEMPRLRDDAQGYGPNGRDFIVHVDLPGDIESAWRTLEADDILQRAMGSRALA